MADSPDVTDALDVLGNEIRVAILRELAEADGPLSFTELRERTGIRDTGKFNYHLTKLCSYFVREADGGYELGHAGSRVVSAVDPRASAEESGEVAPEETCPVCGDEDCEKLFHVHLTPPWR
ncbi:winged helix-turn-helix domain-containing protein [Halorussus limi]|uniref:Winged helix-turn-helix domain-containing protein n=1 Tax=Halorussus limi TaxID=2938695 RepID=A0A8U0HSY2_9EURY|nr:winged helix-turn-helix domain-containing protein [Halorussus limi]UPV74175.1 winged helix-turn-helix domain-containing protein [Halorussus limi]